MISIYYPTPLLLVSQVLIFQNIIFPAKIIIPNLVTLKKLTITNGSPLAVLKEAISLRQCTTSMVWRTTSLAGQYRWLRLPNLVPCEVSTTVVACSIFLSYDGHTNQHVLIEWIELVQWDHSSLTNIVKTTNILRFRCNQFYYLWTHFFNFKFLVCFQVVLGRMKYSVCDFISLKQKNVKQYGFYCSNSPKIDDFSKHLSLLQTFVQRRSPSGHCTAA